MAEVAPAKDCARVADRLHTRDNHVQFSGHEVTDHPALLNGVRPDWPWLVLGEATVYEPTTAHSIGHLMAPHRTVRQLKGLESTAIPASAATAVGPAILVNHVGEGTVLTFATSPDQALWSDYALPETRRLLTGGIRSLLPQPLITVDAPAFVEAVVNHDSDRREMTVHLISYSPTPAPTPVRRSATVPRPYVFPGLIEDPAHFRAVIELREPVLGASAHNPSTRLTHDGNRVTVLIDDVHDAITVVY